MTIAGTFSNPAWVIGFASGFSAAAVTAGQTILIWGGSPLVAANLGGIQAYANGAGSGTGQTVLDVLLNGTSIWTRTADRPTLAATSTGPFQSQAPVVKALKQGDRLQVTVPTIPSVSGHSQVSVVIAIESPHGSFGNT